MSEESNLAAEFQVCHSVSHHDAALAALDSRTALPSQRLVAQRSGTLFGYPADLLRSQGVDNSWVLIFNPGQEDEGVCAAARRPSEPIERRQRRR